MKLVQILGTSGNQYVTTDSPNSLKTAMGNADHRVGSWAYCDGDYLFGRQQFSEYTPYVPESSACILEFIGNVLTSKQITNSGLVENDKVSIVASTGEQFSIVYGKTCFYLFYADQLETGPYKLPNGTITFNYQKVSSVGVENKTITFTYPMDDNNPDPSYQNVKLSLADVDSNDNLILAFTYPVFTYVINTIGSGDGSYTAMYITDTSLHVECFINDNPDTTKTKNIIVKQPQEKILMINGLAFPDIYYDANLDMPHSFFYNIGNDGSSTMFSFDNDTFQTTAVNSSVMDTWTGRAGTVSGYYVDFNYPTTVTLTSPNGATLSIDQTKFWPGNLGPNAYAYASDKYLVLTDLIANLHVINLANYTDLYSEAFDTTAGAYMNNNSPIITKQQASNLLLYAKNM